MTISLAKQDGDIIQLGVDYQGGTEEMYRCVKMRIEVGRERQRGQNNFKYVPSQAAETNPDTYHHCAFLQQQGSYETASSARGSSRIAHCGLQREYQGEETGYESQRNGLLYL